MSEGLNDDFSRTVVIDTASMTWEPSPSPTVWRKRLDRAGPAEAGRVTSVVRYDPGSRFHAHPHPDGEEILVLDGVFSDQTGDYPAGSYLLNPEGFEHGPFSDPGCLLFVKLRQYPGTDRRHVLIKTDDLDWQPTETAGVSTKPLYDEDGHPERVSLLRFEAGAALEIDGAGGTEVFVMEGRIASGEQVLEGGAWQRTPHGQPVPLRSAEPATLYVKRGHLADA